MQRDAAAFLEDILTHGQMCLEFINGKSLQQDLADDGLRAMVERKLFIVGEALAQLRNFFPKESAAISNVRQIVGFRNLLAHGYFALDNTRVYRIATVALPTLLAEVTRLKNE